MFFLTYTRLEWKEIVNPQHFIQQEDGKLSAPPLSAFLSLGTWEMPQAPQQQLLRKHFREPFS